MKSLAVLFVGVLAVAVVTAGPVGFMFGSDHWVCGAVGYVLSLPPAVFTLWLAQWFARRSPYGMLIGMAIGPLIRLPVTLIAATGVFAVSLQGESGWAGLSHPLKFWLWVLTAYVVTLIFETALLVRMAPPSNRTGPGG
jgi:hypothetical protein